MENYTLEKFDKDLDNGYKNICTIYFSYSSSAGGLAF